MIRTPNRLELEWENQPFVLEQAAGFFFGHRATLGWGLGWSGGFKSG